MILLILVVLTFESLFSICNAGCFSNNCRGCANNGNSGQCGNGDACFCFVDDAVYGCCGTWSKQGMTATGTNSVDLVCADGYEVCPDASRASDLGLESNDCGSSENDEFFGSQMGGPGGSVCGSGSNDVFGCSKTSAQNTIYNTNWDDGPAMPLCGDTFVASLSTLNSNGWDFSSQTDNELDYATLNDASKGGPLCCKMPTSAPTDIPSVSPTDPSSMPSNIPTNHPTSNPSNMPSNIPTNVPTDPSNMPTIVPTIYPTELPSTEPSMIPSNQPSVIPTNNPSDIPTIVPSNMPTNMPVMDPTFNPSIVPSKMPSNDPTVPTNNPTMIPSSNPTDIPTDDPTDQSAQTPAPTPAGGIKVISIELEIGNGDVNDELAQYMYDIVYEYISNNLTLIDYGSDFIWWMTLSSDATNKIILMGVFSNDETDQFENDIYGIVNSDAFSLLIANAIENYGDGTVTVINVNIIPNDNDAKTDSTIFGVDETLFYIIVASIFCAVFICLQIVILVCCCIKRKKDKKTLNDQNRAMIEMENGTNKNTTQQSTDNTTNILNAQSSNTSNKTSSKKANEGSGHVTQNSSLLGDNDIALTMAVQKSLTDDGGSHTPQGPYIQRVASDEDAGDDIHSNGNSSNIVANSTNGTEDGGAIGEAHDLEQEINEKEKELRILKQQRSLELNAKHSDENNNKNNNPLLGNKNKDNLESSGEEDNSEELYTDNVIDPRKTTTSVSSGEVGKNGSVAEGNGGDNNNDELQLTPSGSNTTRTTKRSSTKTKKTRTNRLSNS